MITNDMRWRGFLAACRTEQWDSLSEPWQDFYCAMAVKNVDTDAMQELADLAIRDSILSVGEMTAAQMKEAAIESGLDVIYRPSTGEFALSPVLPEGWQISKSGFFQH